MLQAYVNVPVPPVAVILIAPVDCPKQFTLLTTPPILIAVDCVTVNELVAVHEFASVTVTVYVPDVSDEISSVDAELLQAYVNVPVPPVAVILIAPVDCPKQFTLLATPPTLIAVGCVTVNELVAVHEFASVTVTV